MCLIQESIIVLVSRCVNLCPFQVGNCSARPTLCVLLVCMHACHLERMPTSALMCACVPTSRLPYCRVACLQLATNSLLYKHPPLCVLSPNLAISNMILLIFALQVLLVYGTAEGKTRPFSEVFHPLLSSPFCRFILAGSCFKIRLPNGRCHELIQRDYITRAECCQLGGFYLSRRLTESQYVRDILLQKAGIPNCAYSCQSSKCSIFLSTLSFYA